MRGKSHISLDVLVRYHHYFHLTNDCRVTAMKTTFSNIFSSHAVLWNQNRYFLSCGTGTVAYKKLEPEPQP